MDLDIAILLKHRIEYLALCCVRFLVCVLPYRAALALGEAVARIAFHLLRFRRRETVRRIRSVFGPDLTVRQARRIAWLSLRNTIFNAVELLRIGRTSSAELRSSTEGYDTLMQTMRELLERHGGLVVALPHMGNWDLAGAACRMEGLPVFSIAARQRNPLVNALIDELRRSAGMDVLERGSGTLRQVISRLRHGGALAILPDVRMRHADLRIPFLGGMANLGRGMAQFAKIANVPILPVLMTRIGRSRKRFDICAPLLANSDLDKSADIYRMSAFVIADIDQAIRRAPEQWFWYNKRWVLDPVD